MADDKKRDVYFIGDSLNFPTFRLTQPMPRMEMPTKPAPATPPADKAPSKK
ncbi:MAG: hypothetical protein K0Q80_2709, partial [Microvirga sp.]|nr:hypothetical protein [Microvirga sp.]